MSETPPASSQGLVDLTLSWTTTTSSFRRPPCPKVTSPDLPVFSFLPSCDEESSCASPLPDLDDDDDDDDEVIVLLNIIRCIIIPVFITCIANITIRFLCTFKH